MRGVDIARGPTARVAPHGSAITAAPVIVDGRVIVGSANGTVTAFGLAT